MEEEECKRKPRAGIIGSGMQGKRQDWGGDHFPSFPFAIPALLFVGLGAN